MNTPKVSILIPVYNRKEYIAECIQSALDQTFTDFEIIVVDNASNDGTWEICQQFEAKDQRLRIFRNNINIGPVRNWLACVERAQGEFGKILFSDDLMFPTFIEHTLPYLENTEVGFVSTATWIGSEIENRVVRYLNSNEEQILSSERYFELLLTACAPFSPGAAIFRMVDMRLNLRSSFPSCISRDFSKNGAGPDVLLYALTALSYKSVVMLHVADVFFRGHADSFTTANSDEVTKGYRSALAWFFRAKLSKDYWIKYVARAWISKVINTCRLTSLTKHCLELEGRGGIIETSAVLMAVAHIAIVELFRSAYKGIKQ
jgi:glycosyltransferase involved in cell wall biosynthesis